MNSGEKMNPWGAAHGTLTRLAYFEKKLFSFLHLVCPDVAVIQTTAPISFLFVCFNKWKKQDGGAGWRDKIRDSEEHSEQRTPDNTLNSKKSVDTTLKNFSWMHAQTRDQKKAPQSENTIPSMQHD